MSQCACRELLKKLRIFWALIRRDLFVLGKNYRRMVIDALFVTATQATIFLKLFPLLGMPPAFATPIYVGTSIGFVFFLGFASASALTEDLERNRFIDYYLTLPISRHWILAKYVVSFAIENSIIIAPLVIAVVGLSVGFKQTSWFYFLFFYPTTLSFLGLLFLMFGMRYKPLWFRSNIWPRRLLPMLFFNAGLSTWWNIYNFSPVIAYLMLLNPMSYASEGLRATLLEGNYLPVWFCMGAFTLFALPIIWLLNKSIKTRLDPV